MIVEKKRKLVPVSIMHTRTNSKCDRELNQITAVLEQNMGENHVA